MTAPRLKIKEVRLHGRDFRLRIPFRYGMVTLEAATQAFARVRVDVDGYGDVWGASAEVFAPKWFDKRAELTNEQDVENLKTSVRIAAEGYLASGPDTAFGIFAGNYSDQLSRCAEADLPPLAAGFGPALLDRAVADALAKAKGLTFAETIQRNLIGLDVRLTPDLGSFDLDAFLGSLQPLEQVHARHTVGLIDALHAGDLAPGDRLNDGLPETLEDVIAAYGHRYFKLKIGGEVASDLERLRQIAAVLDQLDQPYFASLDGNEQYQSAEGILELMARVAAAPSLERFRQSLIYFEQPIHRAASAVTDVSPLAVHAPVVIDESDATLSTFPEHRPLGYAGVSSKCCKGYTKSLLNLARCKLWNQEAGAEQYFLTGEDLTMQAGLAVQQDLTLVSLLGISHVERNGHHFIFGMSAAGDAEQAAFLGAHPELYRSVSGTTCLDIRDGILATDGLISEVGFASKVEPDWDAMDEVFTLN